MTNCRKSPRFKKIYWLYFILVELALMADMFVHADEIKAIATTPLSDSDYLIKGLISIAGFFIIRFMYRVDKNQGRLFEQTAKLNERLSNLEGSHAAYTQFGMHSRKGDK